MADEQSAAVRTIARRGTTQAVSRPVTTAARCILVSFSTPACTSAASSPLDTERRRIGLDQHSQAFDVND